MDESTIRGGTNQEIGVLMILVPKPVIEMLGALAIKEGTTVSGLITSQLQKLVQDKAGKHLR
jgi:hypothetical protein